MIGKFPIRVSLWRLAAITALMALFVLVLLAALLPNYELARLREEYSLFNQPMMWAEGFGRFNMVHLLLFGALGCLGCVLY